MLFYVRYIDDTFQERAEIFEFSSQEILEEYFEVKGFMPVSITPIPSFLAILIPKRGRGIKNDDIIELIENLHLIVKSGLPLYHGLVDMANESDNIRFRRMLEQIAFEINRGKSLSQAFKPYEKIMGSMVINLIKIGEETGQLEVTLKRGAEFLKRVSSLKKKAKSALIYPSFALVAVSAAMLVWMIYVLPQMTSLFEDMGIELPAITKFVIALSDFLSKYIVYILLFGFLFALTLFNLYKKKESVRRFVDKMFLKIPVIQSIISGFNTAFISEYLRLAIVSGIPLFGALDTLRKNIKNQVYKDALKEVTSLVTQGNQLSASFAQTKLFTPFVIRMMSVGEQAGTLDAQLELLSNYYYEKVDYLAENIGKVIEPAVLVIVGSFMALIMLALMGPMYDMISQMQ